MPRGTARVLGTPAPVGRACGAAGAEAMGAPSPRPGMSTLQRAWLVWGVPAVVGPTARGGARVARARRGSEALAARAWLCRHNPLPWDERWGGALVGRARGEVGAPPASVSVWMIVMALHCLVGRPCRILLDRWLQDL